MSELERLQSENPYHNPLIRSLAAAWDEGTQAAWDAGWRPVPGEEEIMDWLFRDAKLPETGVEIDHWAKYAEHFASCFRQWLLEREG